MEYLLFHKKNLEILDFHENFYFSCRANIVKLLCSKSHKNMFKLKVPVWKKYNKNVTPPIFWKLLCFPLCCVLNIFLRIWMDFWSNYQDFFDFAIVFMSLYLHPIRYLLDSKIFICSEKLWSQFVHFWYFWRYPAPLSYQKLSMKLGEFRQNPSAPPL